MNMHTIPIRQPDPFAEIDREDDAILDRYLSGEHDAQRLARMAAAVAQVPPPKPEPTAEEIAAARQRSDDAMRDACEAYLAMVDGGLRTWTRTERRTGGRA